MLALQQTPRIQIHCKGEISIMKETILGNQLRKIPSIAVGCMRLSEKSKEEMNHFIHSALEQGAYFFDHADIYGGGMSETVFGDAFSYDPSLKREDVFLQSKCGIRQGCYDLSKEYILEAVDGILKRLRTDYLDLLLLHRPDALVEPEEVAAAFDVLFESGKVRHFGVSNHKPMQIALLQKYVRQPLVANQVQFSIPVSNLVANGMEVNMETSGSIDHDGSLLDYCRLHDITLQAWSPFQMPAWKGCFLGSDEYPELNQKLRELAEKYHVSDTTIAAAWILRHPANMQLITGTASESRLEIAMAQPSSTLRTWSRTALPFIIP